MPNYKIIGKISIDVLVKRTDDDSDNTYVPHKLFNKLGGITTWDTDVLNVDGDHQIYYSASTTYDAAHSDLLINGTYISGEDVDDNDYVKFVYLKHLGVDQNDNPLAYGDSPITIESNGGNAATVDSYRVDSGEVWFGKWKEGNGPKVIGIHADTTSGTAKVEVFALCDS